MSSNKDAMKNILTVALSVCFICSVVVAGAAVSLKPERLANKELDRNKNILIAASRTSREKTGGSGGRHAHLYRKTSISIITLIHTNILIAARRPSRENRRRLTQSGRRR